VVGAGVEDEEGLRVLGGVVLGVVVDGGTVGDVFGGGGGEGVSRKRKKQRGGLETFAKKKKVE
jgi:hypothetical protein